MTVNVGDLALQTSFVSRERLKQTALFVADFPGKIGFKDMEYRLHPDERVLNLAPSIRDVALRYFSLKKISWHTHSNHALSSQVCCLNFLMPLAENPRLLSSIIGRALGIDKPQMLPVENGPDERPWFVGFEWNGNADYLNEGNSKGERTRGSNSTSADAIVRFQHAGSVETVLIEWKYTESYGSPIPPNGNRTRIFRYKDLIFDTLGPVRADLGLKLEDFFYEPFYQLVRQQMMAFQMQLKRESGAGRVRVLHISPAANVALRKITSPVLRRFGDNSFPVFRSLLVHPENFVSRYTEDLFGPIVLALKDTTDWATYIARRYAFVAGSSDFPY